MNILLIDTSSAKIEFSYFEDKKFKIKEVLPPENNADMLIYFIKKSFNEKGINLNDIGYVSLSNGPGSFTGLRIGSAIAKGICFCTGSKLIEISTLDIIANKFNGDKKIISMIFSNLRTTEFYYCEYEKIDGNLIRLSDYKKDLPENILKNGYEFVVNEKDHKNVFNIFNIKFSDLSEIPNSDSHLELTLESIKKRVFSNYNISEPLYMNEFIPKI